MFQIAIIFGGPSQERGISLNSARSVCDHLESEIIEMVPIYCNPSKEFFRINRSELYSNTPADFDFKIETIGEKLSEKTFLDLCKSTNICFPVMHGEFGEDGKIQRLLEKHSIPFIGSGSETCENFFPKHSLYSHLKSKNYLQIETHLLDENNFREKIDIYFTKHPEAKSIIKPNTSGSSIGVAQVNNREEAETACKKIFEEHIDTQVVLQSFVQGSEFTLMILQNPDSQKPIALLPGEIHIEYTGKEIFDYRKKYLPSSANRKYHSPPLFRPEITKKIQQQAEEIFTFSKASDFLRLDGWVLYNGDIYFSDFNTVSGMEQNSFLFLQSAFAGLSHKETLLYILKSACAKYNIPFPEMKEIQSIPKIPIPILFGGQTAERQVSLMSGTNVWLKLLKSKIYQPIPFLLTTEHQVLPLPYSLYLYHTVEEIQDAYETFSKTSNIQKIQKDLQNRLGITKNNSEVKENRNISLESFLKNFDYPFLFLALHGGIGENGSLQKILEDKKIPFNGSGSKASRICMDKYKTAQIIDEAKIEGVFCLAKKVINIEDIQNYKTEDLAKLWEKLTKELNSEMLIVKPSDDGCSAGVAKLEISSDLESYFHFVLSQAPCIPAKTLSHQENIIELPTSGYKHALFEPYQTTDVVRLSHKNIEWKHKNNWIEVTVGVLGSQNNLHSLSPSFTISDFSVLTVEEKFQGGTGVNITPPPETFVSKEITEKVKQSIEKVATALGIRGYARIDCFINITSGEIIVIEANTLPGLTPSTVIYQQALKEIPPLNPTAFLERIIEIGMKRYS